MSEANIAEVSAEPVSDSALFYPQENATTDTDSTGTTVDAEAVEVEQSAIDETPEKSKDNDGDSVESKPDSLDDDGADSDEPLFFELNGKEISVADVQEGLDNGLRQSDYTKKTQKLAEESKEVEAQGAKAIQAFDTLSGHIEALEHAFKEQETAVDWDHLREYDTAEFLRLKEEHENKQTLLESARTDAQKLKDEANSIKLASEQEKLKEFFSDWSDPATGEKAREKDTALINTYVTENGFTNDEFAHLDSSKLMIAIHKAAQYDALRKDGEAVEKQVRKAPRVQKPSVKKQAQKSTSTVELFYGTK